MLSRVHVMGLYWREAVDERSHLGDLMASAKELGSIGALRQIEALLGDFVRPLGLPKTCLVVAVPPGPHRKAHPAPPFAAAVGAALQARVVPAIERGAVTAKVRDTPPEHRQAVVEAAGYVVVADVAGCHVVLVDDVILTGTTLRHLAGLLTDAGAARVDAVVACRSRRT